MDVYSGYNQIRMHPGDKEHTSFITNRGLYRYLVMRFDLKNTWATYHRLVNKMFAKQIGKTIEFYVYDMLVNNVKAKQQVTDLGEMFDILREYQIKLNPLKCKFRVSS